MPRPTVPVPPQQAAGVWQMPPRNPQLPRKETWQPSQPQANKKKRGWIWGIAAAAIVICLIALMLSRLGADRTGSKGSSSAAQPATSSAAAPKPTSTPQPTPEPTPEPTPTSDASDEILLYEITADVNDDGTVKLLYHIEWKVLRDDIGALEWTTIGIPGADYIRIEPQGGAIAGIAYSDENGSSVQIDFDRPYRAGEIVSFDFAVIQDHMYQKDLFRTGQTSYVFTPGSFDAIAVDTLTIRWARDGAEYWSPDCTVRNGYCTWTTSLAQGETFTVRIDYPNDALAFGGVKAVEPLSYTVYTGSLKEWNEVRFSSAAASSEIHQNGIVFSAGNAIDGNLRTSWQENVKGNGIGEYLVAFFDGPVTVRLLGLRLGFATYYEQNSRPKTLMLTFSDKTELICDFADVNETVYLELSHPIETSFIRYTILDAYTGSTWTDNCITELSAYN